MMKYLLLIAMVMLAVWLLRRPSRKDEAAPPSPPPPQTPATPTEIVECAHCHVHLPRSDAVDSERGLHYCGAAHRREAEGD